VNGRKAVSGLLAAGLIAALPAVAVAAPANAPHHHKARTAGSGAPPTIPSIVGVRINRGTAALARAGDYVDRDMPERAVASLLNARRNMYAAWRGAVYVYQTTPPPPAEAGSFHRKAHTSGAPVGAGTLYADPVTTIVDVLGFQHTVATSAFGLLDGAKGALRDAVSTTMFAALNSRDAAIQWIQQNQPPPPAADARVHSRRAHASGGAIVADFSTAMPGIVPDLNDELQQTEGLLKSGALTPGEKRIMGQAEFQIFQTEQTVNTLWPPAPAAG
jgi:hypothetical protein